MKRLIILTYILCVFLTIQAKKYTVSSPNGKIKVTVTTDELLQWSIHYNDEQLLRPSVLQMNIREATQQPGIKPIVRKAQMEKVDKEQIAIVPLKQRVIKDRYNQLTLDCKGDYAVVFRVYDNGAAYRFETSYSDSQITVNSETV